MAKIIPLYPNQPDRTGRPRNAGKAETAGEFPLVDQDINISVRFGNPAPRSPCPTPYCLPNKARPKSPSRLQVFILVTMDEE